ncbi:MAG: FoF1 ATP synthase subunit delta [Chthoniobacterales bacterium]
MTGTKEVKRVARELVRGSFTDGRYDSGRVDSLLQALIARSPRNFYRILDTYKRLLRLELEKRHAVIESAEALDQQTTSKVAMALGKKYGPDLTTEFVVNPELLGGMRIRVGSDVWDGTIRNRLERLQKEL